MAGSSEGYHESVEELTYETREDQCQRESEPYPITLPSFARFKCYSTGWSAP